MKKTTTKVYILVNRRYYITDNRTNKCTVKIDVHQNVLLKFGVIKINEIKEKNHYKDHIIWDNTNDISSSKEFQTNERKQQTKDNDQKPLSEIT